MGLWLAFFEWRRRKAIVRALFKKHDRAMRVLAREARDDEEKGLTTPWPEE